MARLHAARHNKYDFLKSRKGLYSICHRLQREREFTAAAGRFIHPDSAAMRFDGELTKIQSDPRAAPPPRPIGDLHEPLKNA